MFGFYTWISLDISSVYVSVSLDRLLSLLSVAKHFLSLLSHSSRVSLHNSAALAGAECTRWTPFVMLKCWISLCQHKVMRDKKESITKRAKQGKQNKTAFRDEGKKKKEVKLKKGVWARLRRSRRGDEEAEVKDKEGKGKIEGESGRAREQAKNAWQGLSILRWMDNVRSMQYTEQHSLCYLTFVHLSLSYTYAWFVGLDVYCSSIC